MQDRQLKSIFLTFWINLLFLGTKTTNLDNKSNKKIKKLHNCKKD